MNSWVTNCWADNTWTAGIWGSSASLMESLGLGDLTTQFAIWLRGVAPDVNTSIRDRLTVHYSYTAPRDVTTLLARFLQYRS